MKLLISAPLEMAERSRQQELLATVREDGLRMKSTMTDPAVTFETTTAEPPRAAETTEVKSCMRKASTVRLD